MPETKHGDPPEFVSVSSYEMWPAPALPSRTVNEPCSVSAAHAAVTGFAVVVVVAGAGAVTVRTCVTVFVTVTVFVAPHPESARTARRRTARLMPWVFATVARAPPRAR